MNIEMPKNNENKESAMEAELNRLKRNESRLGELNHIDFNKKEISLEKKKIIKQKIGQFLITIGGYATAVMAGHNIIGNIEKLQENLSHFGQQHQMEGIIVEAICTALTLILAEIMKQEKSDNINRREDRIGELEKLSSKSQDRIYKIDQEEFESKIVEPKSESENK